MNMLPTLVQQQIKSLASQSRIIVVHPNFAKQHMLLSAFGEPKVYVRLQGNGLDLDTLQVQVLSQMPSQALKSGEIVVVDEVDRAQPEMFAQCVAEHLLPKLGKGRMIILGRTVPLALLTHPALKGHIQLLPVDPDYMLADYTAPNPNGRLLEVWALGSGHVLIDGVPVENWDGVLPRALFFYLVDRGMTTRTEIFDAFWPNLSVREATNVFHVTKRKVSEVIGVDLTVFQSGFYRIAPEIHLQYDVSRFNYFAQEAEGAEAEHAEALLRQAIGLYRGSYISTLSTPYTLQRREEMRATYSDVLANLARLLEQRGDHTQALSWYLRAFHEQPLREELVIHLLRLCKSIRFYEEGRMIYRRHEAAMRAAYDLLPADSVRELARALGGL